MKKTTIAGFMLFAGLSSAGVNADNLRGWYAGAGATRLDTGSSTAGGGSIDFSTAEIFGGFKYNGYLGGELRLGTGLSSDSVNFQDVNYEFNVSHYESIYYRAETVNQVARLYGLLGLTNIGISADPEIANRDSSKSGISYGVGVGFITGSRTNLNFEYRTLVDTENDTFETISASIDFRF